MTPVPRGVVAANLVVVGLTVTAIGFTLGDGRLQTLGLCLSFIFGGLSLIGTGVVVMLRRQITWGGTAGTAISLFVGLWFVLAVLCQS